MKTSPNSINLPCQKSSFHCSYCERANSHHRNELDDGTIKKMFLKSTGLRCQLHKSEEL